MGCLFLLKTPYSEEKNHLHLDKLEILVRISEFDFFNAKSLFLDLRSLPRTFFFFFFSSLSVSLIFLFFIFIFFYYSLSSCRLGVIYNLSSWIKEQLWSVKVTKQL